jgi:hypothetical protein
MNGILTTDYYGIGQTLLDQIGAAHTLTGAPGAVVGYYSDGRYKVRVTAHSGAPSAFKLHRFRTGKGNRVTVFCAWTINRKRQRRQVTLG